MQRTKKQREIENEQRIQELHKAGDWDGLIAELDLQDASRERWERLHESLQSEVRNMYNAEKGSEKAEIYRQYKFSTTQNIPFEDLIFDSPDDLHEMVTDKIHNEPLKNLTDKQRQALYYNVACLISSADLPVLLGTSERNIRKHKESAVKKIQKVN